MTQEKIKLGVLPDDLYPGKFVGWCEFMDKTGQWECWRIEEQPTATDAFRRASEQAQHGLKKMDFKS